MSKQPRVNVRLGIFDVEKFQTRLDYKRQGKTLRSILDSLAGELNVILKFSILF